MTNDRPHTWTLPLAPYRWAYLQAEQKALRILTEARLTIAQVGPKGVAATCRGFTDGAVYVLGWLPGTGWHCSCPARRRCAHLSALGLVVTPRVVRERVPA